MTDLPESSSFPNLAPTEIRVLGVLTEKQRTVPDSYPLTLNALVAGCNQKTSRQPIMELSESQVQIALEELRGRSLVTESSGGRAYRYAHNADRVLKIPSQSLALLTVLMLRGPQTAGELRLACERMHNFADISSVEAFLDELAERPAGALVRKLPRQPGARESRWVHLLGGEPDLSADEAQTMDLSGASNHAAGSAELAALQTRVAALEAQLAQTQAMLARISSELGLPTHTDTRQTD